MASELQLQLVASLLRRGRLLDQLSGGLTLLALAIGLAPLLGSTPSSASALLCGLLVMLGLAQKYWAVRVALDGELFARLARQPQQLAAHTQQLDLALTGLGLQPATAGGRDWDARSRGALQLLRRQALWLGAQVLLALAAILAMPWFSFAG
ncbi:hypothetical protein F3I16_01940 [Pseudomonas sp. L-22-4S-12]|uniref:hypothetical protein n=1 Tax=Pseudomonas sp. L-22-4S-12 TaxID=2610893 RepID=UPI001323BB4B|nr:hypothetical protein [Pseudomonas sp. L-22-4S-12]MWV14793.1 hypothetical protein [Pseudomonas sp. L-22-4S-12]